MTWHGSRAPTTVAVVSDLRYSARSLTRTPGLSAALLLTIAFGIGSNAVVHGFVRGLLSRDLPLPNSDGVVSVVAGDADGSRPVSYNDYLSIKTHSEVFEWVGAARESQGTIVVDGRSSMVRLATLTPELGVLFQLSLDEHLVISHRMRQQELRLSADRHADTIRIDGVDAPVGSVAPAWLEGLYLGRPVDIWVPWAKATIQDIDRSSRTVWVIARLRAGISIDRAETLINTGPRGAVSIRIFPYSGITPEMAHGLSRTGTLLLAAAAGVFLIACANVACLLLSRASARSQETAVRVALGASRAQLARQLLSDSVLISVAGGALGMLLAMWTTNVVPLLFFDKDAVQLVFAPDLVGISAVSAACVSITIACGLVPLFEIRADRPAAVLQRENAGPSTSMRRLRMALVVGQMALCCALVIATGLLLESFRSALQTNPSHPLRGAILATVESRPRLTPSETAASGMAFFSAVEGAARSVPGVTPRAWVATLPGGLPAWQQFRVEPPDLPITEALMDVALFTPASLSHIRVPPIAGRLFSGQDTPQACRVAVVNDVAARDVFGGDAVGRLINDPSGQSVEIVGVVASRQRRRKRYESTHDLLLCGSNRYSRCDSWDGALSRTRATEAFERGAGFERRVGGLFQCYGLDTRGRPSLRGRSRRRLPRRCGQSGGGRALLRRECRRRGGHRSSRPPYGNRWSRAFPAAPNPSARHRAFDLFPDGAGLPARHDAYSRRSGGERPATG